VKAAAVLQDLAARGVRLEVHGTDLIADGPADALPDELIDRLRAFKAELLGHLGGAVEEQPWAAADWRAYFHERAAVREHDGGLSRPEAECLAFEDAVSHWLCLHSAAATDPRHGCVYCGRSDQDGNILLPVLAPGGHVWVHDRCGEPWHATRRREAATALHSLGVYAAASRGSERPHPGDTRAA
jgi:TubC N-terminal docking domain